MKIASSRTTVPPDVFARDLHQLSINIRADGGADKPSLDLPPEAEAPSTGAEAMQAEGSTPLANLEPDWRVPYLDYLTRGDLPSDKTKARRTTRWAKSFVIFGDNKALYRHSPTGILQCCITNEEGRNLLKDLHSGGFRSSRGTSNPRWKRIPTRFLLANRSLRHCQASALLQRMPVLHKTNPHPGSRPANYSHHMVIRCLGARLGRTPEEDN
jgi:hypothetical protein